MIDPVEHPGTEPVCAWQRHLDAGRIGANPPTPAAVLARLHATDALFRSLAGRPSGSPRA